MVHDLRCLPPNPEGIFAMAVRRAEALTVLGGMALVAALLYAGPISYYIGMSVFELAMFLALLFFAISCVISLAYLLIGVFKKRLTSFKPIVINMITLAILI